MSIMWDILGVIGAVAVVLAVLWFFSNIRDVILDEQREENERLKKAMLEASEQPIDRAVNTLKTAGIYYYTGTVLSVDHFVLPSCFWKPGDIVLKAKTLLTVLNGYENSGPSSCQEECRDQLIKVLARHAKRNSHVVFAIICQLGRLANDNWRNSL